MARTAKVTKTGTTNKVIPDLGKKINDIDIDPRTGDRLTGTMQSRFKKVSGDDISSSNMELHHIIPKGKKISKHPVVVSGSRAGFDIESLNNGIPLPKYSPTRNLSDGVHATHPQLNIFVKNKLDIIGRARLSDAENALALQSLRNTLRNDIEILMGKAKPGLDNRINEFYRLKNNK